ncbi:MAG: M28 family peptidase [Rikenellaceae bacterium]|nr:M28 family peptidase [Rikenellaceae bacterium]
MKRLVCIVLWLVGALAARGEGLRADTTVIAAHLRAITKTDGFRNYKNTARLDATAGYIHYVFGRYADTVFYQPYQVGGRTYRNVVCRFGTKIGTAAGADKAAWPAKPVVVVGAHYDVCGDQQGADDNASGVVGLLEIARMLHGAALTRPVELVAYTLEEPPFFRTPYMGSNVHAQSLKAAGTPVYGMVAVEMIGYFSDLPRSQDYPIGPMKVLYGRTGDYILLVKRSGFGPFVQAFSARFSGAQIAENPQGGAHCAGGHPHVEVNSLKAPAKISGVDFSDHLNYWNAGYDAMMVTNTAFFRNKNYHQTTDTMETLDLPRMAVVIDALRAAIVNIDSNPQTQSAPKYSKSIK